MNIEDIEKYYSSSTEYEHECHGEEYNTDITSYNYYNQNKEWIKKKYKINNYYRWVIYNKSKDNR